MTVSDVENDEKREKVADMITSFVSKVEETDHGAKAEIFKEIESLQNLIESARKDLGSTGATEISQKHIPSATDELDAIVESTAAATSSIMDSCELIQEKASEIEHENVAIILDEVMKIFEACSFQDVTGQRTSKVVSLLQNIEERVSGMLSVLAKRLPGIEYKESEDEREGDDKLLNGPQMADKAISQVEIDALLDDLFD